jgi:diguanylate cyclase
VGDLDLRLHRHVPGRRFVLYALALGLIAVLALVSLDVHNSVVDWIYELVSIVTALLAAGACLRAAASRYTFDRNVWRFFGFGAASWAVGDIIYTVIDLRGGDATGLTPADGFYFLLLPLWSAALVARLQALVRRRPLHFAQSFGGPLLVIALSAAAVTQVVLPLVGRTRELEALLVNAVYPVGDLVLVSLFVAVLLFTPRTGRINALLGITVLTFTCADILYAYTAVTGTYRPGVPIDVFWLISFTSLAAAAALARIPGAQGWEPRFEPRRLPGFLGTLALVTLGIATWRTKTPWFFVVAILFVGGLFALRRDLIRIADSETTDEEVIRLRASALEELRHEREQ